MENQDSTFFPKLWKLSHTKCFVLHQNVVHGWFSKKETSDPISSKITIHKWTNITQENIKKIVYSSCECASGGERHRDRKTDREREQECMSEVFSLTLSCHHLSWGLASVLQCTEGNSLISSNSSERSHMRTSCDMHTIIITWRVQIRPGNTKDSSLCGDLPETPQTTDKISVRNKQSCSQGFL